VRLPWKEHVRPYLDNGCFFVKYEDLLSEPQRECERILAHLGLQCSRKEVVEAIDRQSFERRKELHLRNGEASKARFLRVGRSGQWKTKLPAKHREVFVQLLGDELSELGYPLDKETRAKTPPGGPQSLPGGL
jgi:hypothetical protein